MKASNSGSRQSYRRRPPKVLEEFYYLDHFEALAAGISKTYSSEFLPDVSNFLNNFSGLSRMCKALIVRSGSWKKNFFSLEDFEKYSEIQDRDNNLEKLCRENWFQPMASDANQLRFFEEATISELKSILKKNGVKFPASAAKKRLLELAYTAQDLKNPPFQKYRLTAKSQIQKIMYLYFGSGKESLSAFALRDLGLRSVSLKSTNNRPRFESAEIFESEFFYSQVWKDVASKSHHWWWRCRNLPDGISQWPQPKSIKAKALFNKSLVELSKLDGIPEGAELEVLRFGDADPAQMKFVRALWKAGAKDKALAKIEDILKSPSSAEEALEAEDFESLKTGVSRHSSVTRKLRDAPSIVVDEAYKRKVEKAVCLALEKRGEKVLRSENRLWRTLFGLIFWDLLYGKEAQGPYSEFERMPPSIVSCEFSSRYSEEIKSRLERLFKPEMKKRMLRNYTENYGKKNGIFRWRNGGLDPLYSVLQTGDTGIRKILWSLSQNFMENRSGYPDLVRLKDKSLEFIEVKGEGDAIRRNQLSRMRELETFGFSVEVLKATFSVSPDQIYIVVDVETTGGRAANHKVTEIGAVKMVGNAVVDEFQTLLNPGRSIPWNIVRLTGITDAMVSGAPVFSDVADDFLKFCEGGIFVAHNVQFDYSFLKEEFSRIGRRFHMSKLCTCALSRKNFKGLRSYGLANLSKYFEIDLKNHHRALADARAAAEILKRLNAVRSPVEQAVVEPAP